MPELPEVETVKNGLSPIFIGRRLTKVVLNRNNLRTPFSKTMVQDMVDTICVGMRRRGKYIWMDLDNGKTLVIHLGMSGSFTINPSELKKHDHVIIENDVGDVVAYHDPRRFGMMFFVETDKEHHHKAFASMGVEPLGNEFSADMLLNKLKDKKIPIKPALLEQNIIAGIGNIYACEALYRAGISPLRPSNQVKKAEADKLVQSIRDVLNDAIKSGGSTLRDHRQTDGTMGYFQHHFDVYDRAGETCKITGEIITRIVQSGRSTFYCPAHQK